MTLAATATVTAILSLMKMENLGRRTALKIVDGPIEETDLASGFEALEMRVSRWRDHHFPLAELRAAWTKSVAQLDQGRNDGILALSFHDEGYPDRLRNIPDPPAILFVKGKSDGLHSALSLAVVGTREPTSFGMRAARSSAKTAVEFGFAIVSGLAHGCDALAHDECVESGGIGTAVLAHGLDKVYPAENRKLAQLLLEKGGCLVSEYPFGVKPIRRAFAERNRLQCGLSDAVLVIETDIEGGTMRAAKFARAQKRELACIEHTERYLDKDNAKGNQKLIKDGWAIPIPNTEALNCFLNRLILAGGNSAKKANEQCVDERQLSWVL